MTSTDPTASTDQNETQPDNHYGSDRARRLARIDRMATVLDAQFVIPGTGWRFGLDGLIGLIPGIGDTATALLSLWIVWQGIKLGVGPLTVLRMLVNVALDAIIGTIPLVGDIFDFAFKANLANIRLIQKHADRHP